MNSQINSSSVYLSNGEETEWIGLSWQSRWINGSVCNLLPTFRKDYLRWEKTLDELFEKKGLSLRSGWVIAGCVIGSSLLPTSCNNSLRWEKTRDEKP